MNEPKIFTTSEWGAKPVTSTFKKSPAAGIVVHNTDHKNRDPKTGSAERSKAFALARDIQKDHTTPPRNWADTGQHFTISRGGVIMEGRHGTLAAARQGLVVQAAHAGSSSHNKTWWGIELEGRNLEAFAVTEQQWKALIELAAWLVSKGNFPATSILPHLEVKVGGTDCPGKVVDRLADLRASVAAALTA